ncbi:MAG: hypothetical protein KDA53_12590 [Hyphomonas sp.]|nr:hypothetical protein [Hyphomonas sp.]
MADFVTIRCCECREFFGMSRDYYEVAQRTGQFWYCPSGHRQHFARGPSEAEKLREELNTAQAEQSRLRQQLAYKDDRIREERESRESTERRLSATKGVVTRIKNRVAAGTCPCCNRTFQNLARHMRGQHPDYTTQEEVVVDG